MHRPSIGIIALTLIGLAIWCTFTPWAPSRSEAWQAAFWRMGAVMAMLWLAHPQLKRLPGWLLLPIVGSVLLAAWRPRLVLVGLIVLIAAAALKPRQRRSTNRAGTASDRFK